MIFSYRDTLITLLHKRKPQILLAVLLGVFLLLLSADSKVIGKSPKEAGFPQSGYSYSCDGMSGFVKIDGITIDGSSKINGM